MATHFIWYPSVDSVLVPWNASYEFPSQANRTMKMTPRIPPKTGGGPYGPGNMFRLEFPAQGYVNPLNTTLEFDVTLVVPAQAGTFCRFQNNIQSIFQRVRTVYGSMVPEDIRNYNVIVRLLSETTGNSPTHCLDQSSITDGIAGAVGSAGGLENGRQQWIQGVDQTIASGFAGVVPNQVSKDGFYYCTRRYQVSLALGLMTQPKLLPTKYMASQFGIEITLANAADCIFHSNYSSATLTTGVTLLPTYTVSNINLIPEILEFDSSYDLNFYKGLVENGIPIKFSSWHTWPFTTGGGATLNLQIQERSRSVKALFAVQRRNPSSIFHDSGAMIFCSNNGDTNVDNTLQSYQFRIGGRYYPSSPVQCAMNTGSSSTNGAVEAYIELQKALSILGDDRLSTPVNCMRWGLMPAGTSFHPSTLTALLTPYSELDFCNSITGYSATGSPIYTVGSKATEAESKTVSGVTGSECFCVAINLDVNDGVDLAGLNAAEQSDISLMLNYAKPQNTAFVIEVYSYYDAMILLKENNVLELIE